MARTLAVLTAVGAFLFQSVAAFAQPPGQPAYNLSSTTQSMVAGGHGATIKVGAVTDRVTPGQLVTPAEMVALMQVLDSGHQSLVLGSLGNAVGGRLNVTSDIGSTLGALLVPKGVTAVANFATAPTLTVNGDLSNSGKIYVFSSNLSVQSGTISATDILNQQGAVISSVLPSTLGSLLGSKVSDLSFTLNASNNVVNAGTISSAGSLTVAAGGSITNALPAATTGTAPLMQADSNVNLVSSNIISGGTIVALSGNINITTPTPANILVNNTGGTLQALNGSVNVRDAQFTQDNDVSISGGQILSQQLNVYTGSGQANIDADNVTGTVNIYGGSASVSVDSPNLQLGTMDLSGDPTFYNENGNVTITEPLVFNGENLAIVASGNIVSGAGVTTIDTSSGSISGGEITLIAGAAFSGGATTSNLPTSGNGGDSGSNLTITGGTTQGGQINFAGMHPINTITSAATGGTGNGGKIIMLAYAGSASGSGSIVLPSSGRVISDSANAVAGGILLDAAATSGVGIQAGNFSVSGGGSDGAVTMSTYAFTVNDSNNHNTISISDGALSAGAVVNPTVVQQSTITVGNIGGSTNPATSVNITSGGLLTVNGNVYSTGAINLSSVHGSIAGAGTLTAGGTITLGASDSIGTAAVPINTDCSTLGVGSLGGSIFVVNRLGVPSATLTLLAPSAAGTLQIVSDCNIVTDTGNSVQGSVIDFQTSPGSNGNITIQENLGNGSSVVQLQADGSGEILQNAGTISASSVSLTSGSGDLIVGFLGPTFTTSNLTFHTGGVMVFGDSEGVTIGASSAGTVNGNVGGTLTIAGPISSQNITLATSPASNGSININSVIGALGGATVSLTAGGAGNITCASTGFVQGSQINLTSPAGQIGSGVPINVSGGTVTVSTSGPVGSDIFIYLNSASDMTLIEQNSPYTEELTVTASGSITVGSNLTVNPNIDAGINLTTSAASNGSINVGNNQIGDAGAVIIFNAGGGGTINTGSSGKIIGDYVHLTSGTGNIGTPGGQACIVDAGSLYINTSGAGAVNMSNTSGGAVTVYSAISGGNFQLTSTNSIILDSTQLSAYAIIAGGGAPSSGGGIYVTSQSGAIQLESNATLSATGGNGNPGDINLTASSGSNGSITLGQYSNIFADGPVNLLVGGGSFGTGGAAPSNVAPPVINTDGVVQYGTTTGVIAQSTTAGINVIVAVGTHSSQASVRFEAPNTTGNQIELEGGSVTIASMTAGHLTSLDLSNHAVAALVNTINLIDPQNVSNQTLTVSATGGATGGTATIDPWDLAPSLTGFNIPAGVHLSLRDFFYQDPINVNISGTSTTKQFVVSGALNLIASGNYGANTAIDPTIVVTSNQAATSVMINPSGSITVQSGVVGIGSLLSITGTGAITVDGPITSPGSVNVYSYTNLTTGASISGATGSNSYVELEGSNLTISGNVTGNSYIELDVSGKITQTAGQLNDASGYIDIQGSFYSAGSAAAPIKTATGSIELFGISAWVSNSGPLSIIGLGVTNLNMTSTGSITVASSSTGAENVVLQPAMNQNITLESSLGTGTGNVTLITTGTGSIVDPSGTDVISGTNIVLQGGSGGVGAIGPNLTTNATTSLTATAVGGIASVKIDNQSPVTLKASSAVNLFDLSNAGVLTVAGAIKAGTILLSTTGNKQITIGAAVGTPSTTSVTLSAGSGNITMSPGAFKVQGTTLNLGSAGDSGDIGDTPGVLRTAATNIALYTKGDITLINTAANTNLASNGQTMDSLAVTASGNLFINSSINVSIATTLKAAGNIVASPGSELFTEIAQLTSTGGSIAQSAAKPLIVNIAGLFQIMEVSASGSAYVDSESASSINVGPSSAGSTLSWVDNSGPLSLSGPIAAPNLSIQDFGGNVNIDGTVGKTGGTTTILTSGSSSILYTNGTVTGNTVTMSVSGSSSTGAIGQSGNSVDTIANNLNVSLDPTNAGGIFITNVSSQPLNLKSASLGAGELGIFTNGALNITGPVTGNGNTTINLGSLHTGGMKVGGAISVTGASGSVGLFVDGAGNISMGASALPITADSITADPNTGSVGIGSALRVNASQLTMYASGNGTASAVNSNAAGVSLDGGSGNTFQVLSTGPISVAIPIVANIVVLKTTANNAGISFSSNVGQNGPSVTLVANGSGSITDIGAVQLLGKTISLSSGSGDIGLSGSPINVVESPVYAPFCTVTAQTGGSGSVFLTSSAISGVINVVVGASSAGQEMQVASTSGYVSTSGAITAPTVVLSSANNTNLTLNGNVGEAGGSTSLTANGTGSIIQKSGTILGAVTSLTSGTGNIGTAMSSIKTAASTLSANTSGTGTVYLTNTLSGAQGLTLLGSSAGGNFQLTADTGAPASSPSLTVGDISTNDGSITTVANSGVLQVLNGDLNAFDGNVTVQNTNSSNGSIQISNSTLSAFLQTKVSGTIPTTGGNVFVFIGGSKPTGTNTTAPAGSPLGSSPLDGGQIFYGKNSIDVSPSASGSIIAQGANVTFSTGSGPAVRISLVGTISIIADPPVSPVSAPVLNVPASAGGSIGVPWDGAVGVPTGDSATTGLQRSVTGNAPSASVGVNAPSSDRFSPSLESSISETSTASVITAGRAGSDVTMSTRSQPELLQADPLLPSMPLVGGVSRSRNAAKAHRGGAVSDGAISSPLSSGDALLTGVGSSGASMILPNGVVTCTAGSAAYVDTDGTTTAVLNLYDCQRNSVTVVVDGKTINVAPGNALIWTSRRADDLGSVNPLTSVAYRGVQRLADSAKGMQAFSAEFSLVTALRTLPKLHALVCSSDPRDAQLRKQLLKEAAALSLIKPAMPYTLLQSRSLTAFGF